MTHPFGPSRFTFEEAIRWLDDHGGCWSARASFETVTVSVTVGDRHLHVTAPCLRAEEVRAAVTEGVRTHRRLLALRDGVARPIPGLDPRPLACKAAPKTGRGGLPNPPAAHCATPGGFASLTRPYSLVG